MGMISGTISNEELTVISKRIRILQERLVIDLFISLSIHVRINDRYHECTVFFPPRGSFAIGVPNFTFML